jgi:hypothetical protein
MLTPGASYGSSAFYWWGNPASRSKFPNANVAAEAGWLAGIIGGPPNTASNLPQRDVASYFSPSKTDRFTVTPSTTFALFVGLWGKSRAVFPTFTGWAVFGLPANST